MSLNTGLKSSKLLKLLEQVYEESLRAGIPSIEYEDGLVIYTLTYTSLRGRRDAVVIDAGAGIGYSTIWLASAMADACGGPGCKLIAIEYYGPYIASLKRNLEQAWKTIGRLVDFSVVEANAVDYVRGMEPNTIDIAFVDIDKYEYVEMLRLLHTRLKSNGLAVFHNAYIPAPPREFYEELERSWNYTIVPTRLGIVVASPRRG